MYFTCCISIICFISNTYLGVFAANPRIARRPHVLFLVMQGAQMYARTTPPASSRTIMAKIVHAAELGMMRLGTSLFIAGNSATSSVVRSHLLALAIRDLRRRDAFSQDFLDVRLDKPFSKQCASKCPIISPRVSFLCQFIATSSGHRDIELRRKVWDRDASKFYLSPNARSWSVTWFLSWGRYFTKFKQFSRCTPASSFLWRISIFAFLRWWLLIFFPIELDNHCGKFCSIILKDIFWQCNFSW